MRGLGLAARAGAWSVDVRPPPTFHDEGLRAALELRRRAPETAILVVSQYVEQTYAAELLADGRGGVGLPAQGPHLRHRRLRRDGPPRRGTTGAVEKHIANIFTKLRLAPSTSDNRRVLAVLAYLQGKRPSD